ncbi:MAG: hypothetical protein IJ583_10280 [Firmicutes bacterium]|nr:hypothetical protein [Bacillota bacterium]
MGLFDGLKEILGFSAEVKKWSIRVDDEEYKIEHGEDIKDKIWLYLCDIEEGNINFIILSAPEMINNIPFVQSSLSARGKLQIEVGITDDGEDECNKIYCNDEFGKNEIYKMIMDFYNKGEKIDVSGWGDIVYI